MGRPMEGFIFIVDLMWICYRHITCGRPRILVVGILFTEDSKMIVYQQKVIGSLSITSKLLDGYLSREIQPSASIQPVKDRLCMDDLLERPSIH